MLDVVVSLSDMELCPVLLPLDVDLLHVEQVLVVEHIDCFDLIL